MQTKINKKKQKNCKEKQDTSSLNEEKSKRHRRSAKDIDRHYRCSVESCKKSYGSEGSLAQHMKLKHPDIYHKKSIDSLNLNSTNFINHYSKQTSQQETDFSSIIYLFIYLIYLTGFLDWKNAIFILFFRALDFFLKKRGEDIFLFLEM